MYKETKEKNGVTRIVDNAFIPVDQSNTDYQAYLQWTTKFCEVCEGMGVYPNLTTQMIETCPSCKGSKLNTPIPADNGTSPLGQPV